MLRRSDPRYRLGWGFTLAATELYGDSGYGHVDVITPRERVALCREMIESTQGRRLMLAGHTLVHLYLPDMVCDVGPLEALPAVDIHLRLETSLGETSVHAQLLWESLKDFPIPILTCRPPRGWPI